MTLPPADLDELEKMEREATPAPWEYLYNEDLETEDIVPTGFFGYGKSSANVYCDAALIAAVRNALPDLLRMARRCVEMEAALRQAVDLISIPASKYAPSETDDLIITGTPRYSEGLRRHHAECAALLPVLKAALIGMRLEPEAERRWISCSDALPPIPHNLEEGETYLTFPHFAVLGWLGDRWRHRWDQVLDKWAPPDWTVTHWMPLPPPPGEKGDGG